MNKNLIWFGVIFWACLSFAALAHDKRYAVNSKMHDWFMTLHSSNGPCCADADGNVLMDNDWESVTDSSKPEVHYKVFIQNQWIDVSDKAVVTQPNMYGPTMVWIQPALGHYEIRCFMPGSMG
jgi:hypothetical protein